MVKPADLTGSRAVLPCHICWFRGFQRLGTSRGREERRRGMKRPGAARCKLCVLFATVCFSPALLSTAAFIWYRGMPELLRSLLAPRPRLRAPGSGCCTRRLVHGDLPPSPGQAAGVGAGGAGCANARPVASVAANSHCLSSDARPWRAFRGPGPLGSARGIRGGPREQLEPRAAHAAARLESASTVGFIADQDLLQFIRISSHAPSRRVNFYQVFGANLNPCNLVFPLLERRLW